MPVLKSTEIEARCAATGMRMTDTVGDRARLAQATDHPDVEEVYRRCVVVDDKIDLDRCIAPSSCSRTRSIIQRHHFPGRARYEQMRESHHDDLIDLRDGQR